ncbi:MAG TPA: hypothetical protein VFQ12_03735, partial [Thermoleophilaceae bacterium]|nr:hypothetical protein [Thermoleophilaceae bacterium]
KLYYLRGRVGKRARVRERRYVGPEEIVQMGPLIDPAAEVAAAADDEVPEVLLSGDHARVRQWRLDQSRRRAGLE